MEFVIPLSNNREPTFPPIYKRLHQAILSGTLPAGERLSTTRDLAEHLGISRSPTINCLPKASQWAAAALESMCRRVGRDCADERKPVGYPEAIALGLGDAKAVEAVGSPRRRTSPFRYDCVHGRSLIESFLRGDVATNSVAACATGSGSRIGKRNSVINQFEAAALCVGELCVAGVEQSQMWRLVPRSHFT